MLGSNLDTIDRVDFGVAITVEKMEKISPTKIDLTIMVHDYAEIGYRQVAAYPATGDESAGQVNGQDSPLNSHAGSMTMIQDSYGAKPTYFDGWVISPPKPEMPEIDLSSIIEQLSTPNIKLLWPRKSIYPGTNLKPEIAAPEMNEKTFFAWKEESEPIADAFTLQIQTKDGTVLFSHDQEATGTEAGSTQTYPYADLYKEFGDEHYVNANITDLLILLHEALDQYRAGIFAEPENSGSQIITARNTIPSVQASSDPSVTPASQGDTEDQRNSTLLYWQVFGYTDGKQVAYSERRPIRLGGVSPNGLLCEKANSARKLVPEFDGQDENSGTEQGDLAIYPGQDITLTGEFTLTNCPWKIDVSEFDSSIKAGPLEEDESGQNIPELEASTSGYTFDNVFIDWGDGKSERVNVKLVTSKHSSGFLSEEEHGFKYDDLMKLRMNHQYHYPGTYTVRVYVLPSDDVGYYRFVAGQNNSSIASRQQPTDRGAERIMLAASGMIVSDAGNGYQISKKSGVEAISGAYDAADHAYQVYCNPLHIYVKQDTAATGPLQLADITITSFSTDEEPAASSEQSPLPSSQGGISFQQPTGAGYPTPVGARVSECDYGLWANATLRYIGQGHVKVAWMIDGVVFQTEELIIGPSEMRTDLYSNPDREPIRSEHHLRSPRLVIDELEENEYFHEHKLTVSATVIEDPTLSSVDSSAFVSNLIGSGNDDQQVALPPMGNNTINSSAVYDPAPAGSNHEFTKTGAITSMAKASFQRVIADLGPPYKVVSPPKTYLVTRRKAGAPCLFRFPVQDGEFIIANLRNLNQAGGRYSGTGSLVFNLPDSSSSVREHYAPIAFSGWQIDTDGETVLSGAINTAAETQLDNLPGMKAQLNKLQGTAGSSLEATMDIELRDPTLYQAYSQTASVQKWQGITAPLSPDGDWYSPPQKLNLTRIGWSLVNIEAADNVRIDLSHTDGTTACTNIFPSALGQGEWVGINLGPDAVVYPYTFNLVNTLSMPAPGWGITASGICGTAETSEPIESAFGSAGGTISWSHIRIRARESNVTSEYGDLEVHMTWPDITLVGTAELTYTGQTAESELTLTPEGGGEIFEQYGAVDMRLSNLSFESRDLVWGA